MASSPTAAFRTLCADVLAERRLDALLRLDARDVQDLLSVAEFEGVLPLVEWHLRRSAAWEGLPQPLQAGLAAGARAAAARELFRGHELARVSRQLQDAGLRTLVLKGNALGRWLYASPQLRVCSDVDLLFEEREHALRAADACAGLGYALAYTVGDSNFEMTSRLVVDGITRLELDLHSRLVNAPAYADIFAFEALWEVSRELPGHPAMVRVLAPGHALAHACLNRALDLQMDMPDRLKLLYDVHLLVAVMDRGDWEAFLAMAQANRIAGICLRSIADTVATLGSEVPLAMLQALESAADAEPLDWRRLQDWRYMQWQNLKSLPGTGARVRWLWQRLFPTPGQLRALHGEGGWGRLMWRRVGRGLARWWG